MQERTHRLIERLRTMSFFTNLGTCMAGPVTPVRTWKDAAKANRSKDWDWVLMEARNQFTTRIFKERVDRFAGWNELVEEIKPQTLPVVQRLMETIPVKGHDRVLIEATLGWTLLTVCMEAEYGHSCAPPFYRELWKWYENGHFPCGWDGLVDPSGDFKKTIETGKLIVY